MAIIYSYPLNNSILPTDVILGTTTALFNGKTKNQTKSFTIANLSAYFSSTLLPSGSYVPYTGAVIDVDLGAFDLTAATIIKAGGTAVQYLMADGSVTTTPTLQQVVNAGRTVQLTTSTTGIDVTLVDLATIYQNGFIVTIPAQTGIYPAQQPAPDAYIAYLNGQNPANLAGYVAGFVAVASGLDNICFYASMSSSAGNTRGFESRSEDSHTGPYFIGSKDIGGGITDVFYVDNDGNTRAESFIKTGGTLNETLMADGSVANSNLTLSKYASTTYQTAAGSTIFYSDPIPSSRFANGDMLRINTVTTTTTTSVGYVTTQYFINSTPSLTGATQIAQYVGAGPALDASIYLPMNRYYWVYNNTFIGRNFLTSTSNSDNSTNSLVDSVAIPANQFYIIVLINTTSTDRAALSSFQVRKT